MAFSSSSHFASGNGFPFAFPLDNPSSFYVSSESAYLDCSSLTYTYSNTAANLDGTNVSRFSLSLLSPRRVGSLLDDAPARLLLTTCSSVPPVSLAQYNQYAGYGALNAQYDNLASSGLANGHESVSGPVCSTT